MQPKIEQIRGLVARYIKRPVGDITDDFVISADVEFMVAGQLAMHAGYEGIAYVRPDGLATVAIMARVLEAGEKQGCAGGFLNLPTFF